MTNEHTSLEKYTSHFIRKGCEKVAQGLCVRDERETEQTATYWSQVPLSLAVLLFRSAGLLNRGSWGPSPLWELVLTTACYLQLTQPVCGTGLYNCLTYTCFLRASHLHPIQPVHCQGSTLISSTGCTGYLHRCNSYLTAQSRVNMQQSSNNYFSEFHMWYFSSRSSPSTSHTHFTNKSQGQQQLKNTQEEVTWTTAKNKILILPM